MASRDELVERTPVKLMLPPRLAHLAARGLLLLAAFVIIAAAIMAQRPKRLTDFDQSFYITIAYDLDRHGVFSSGIFDETDSTRDRPSPGMFFVPGYPLLVLAAMRMDARFAEAVRCSVEANHGARNESECEDYAMPMHLIHGLLLAIAVLAIALAAELMFGGICVFWLAGVLATASLAAAGDLLSFVMTESITVALYSLVMLFALLAWQTSRLQYFALSGLFLGLLCLTRPSFVVLFPVLVVIVLLNGLWLSSKPAMRVLNATLAFVMAFFVVVGPWVVRNHVSVGKAGLTEEYGSAALIERFAYNDMTPTEFIRAFPYCVPGLSDLAFDKVAGDDSMRRFLYHVPDSFFHSGRGKRDALLLQHVRLDPIMSQILIDEMRTNWWRHLLVSIPLGWCGMWVGSLWSLGLIPLFAWACVRTVRSSQPLLLLYAAPAIVMLGLHALVANHYTRYNLILIGPYCVGAAWLIQSMIASARSRLRVLAPTR